MFGALLKSWDTAINQSFLSDFMKSYTNDINDPSEILNKQLYPSLVSGAELVGGFTANLSSAALINLFAVDDPLAIPKVIVIKELICLPSMYMMYLIPDQFWWSIGGYYLKQSLGQGWKTPAILMLKSVVDPEVVSLLIGIFLFLTKIDFSVAIAVFGSIKKSKNLNENDPENFGKWISIVCMIPLGLSVPVFYLAGVFLQQKQEAEILRGKITRTKIKRQTLVNNTVFREVADLAGAGVFFIEKDQK